MGPKQEKLDEIRRRAQEAPDPVEHLGDTTTSHGPIGQGASDVPSASQNLSGIGKSQAPAVGADNATSSATPSGPAPLEEEREGREALDKAARHSRHETEPRR